MDMRWAMERVVGHEKLQAALDRISPAARAEYTHATALSWVSYTTLDEVHEAVATVAQENPMKLADRIARVTVERSFTTVWRVFLRFTSDEAIVVRTPAFYAKSRNVGRMETRILSPGTSESIVSEFPTMPDRDIVILAASIETVLTLAGRSDVKTKGERTTEGARFLTRWRI